MPAAGNVYFADLMIQLNLLNEAEADLKQISAMQLNPNDKKEVADRLDKIKEAALKK